MVNAEFTGEGYTKEWSETVRELKLDYFEAKIVIPRHEKISGTELLDYRINLFQKDKH